MTQGLDPRLEKIVEGAAGDEQRGDAIYPSSFPENAAHPTFIRPLEEQSRQNEFRFLPVEIRQGTLMPRSLSRDMLQSGRTTERLKTRDNDEKLSIFNRNPYSTTEETSIPNSPFVRHNPQRQSVTPSIYPNSFSFTAKDERHNDSQFRASEPTAIFHGIDRSRALQTPHEEPRASLNLEHVASLMYTPPIQAAGTPSSFNGFSSPSNRISLRRRTDRPRAMASSEEPEMFNDDKAPSQTRSCRDSIKLPVELRATKGVASSAPPVIHGIQLVSPRELPDKFRQVFPYKLFNAVQSKCFEPIYRTDDNMVISAPTGSGKTAILELAICKLVQGFSLGQFKIVYQAPTKSLCSERVRDWQKKFSHLNLPCAELTGDTDASEMRKAGAAAILVTTPEKWDSITRKWKDYIKLLQMVKLFLIDEVHILKDVRGATLEAVVSRMKSIGVNVRFVALSATVPNSQDIATWLGKDHTSSHLPAHREIFGEEFRPVKLQKYVYGYSGSPNDFAFESVLDAKLPGLIEKHTKGKPMMVFCFTRKSCEHTALKLAEWWADLRLTNRAWPAPTYKVVVGSPELRELVGRGVAFHHAGLDAQDRTAIESAFLKGCISVICCTSTLAVGVNLPCHLVIIKNTACYTDDGLGEYSDLELMQMLGRAGRPQFDDSATAIIMTRSEKVNRYHQMISGQEVLESTLHQNLIEHLNSEIALGTISDVCSAKFWLAGTFLSVRVRLNPGHYKFSCDTGSRDPDQRLEQVCERDIELLQKARLVTGEQRFTSTEYGQAMSKYLVQFDTMKLLLSISKYAKITQILHIISQAAEFKDLRMRPNERACFREVNKSPFIKSPIKENISTYAHKVSLIVQAQLGGVDLPSDKEFNSLRRQFISETGIVFERIKRLIKCVIECKAYDCDAIATCNALELARSVGAGFWENSTLQLRQIPNIGPAAVRKLVQSDVKTVNQMFSMDTAAIERALSRNPPCGRKILDLLASFPRLTLKADVVKKVIKERASIKVQVRAFLGYANATIPTWGKRAPTLTFVATISNGTLAYIWRGPVRKLEKGFEVVFMCELLVPEDIITCILACEDIVGTSQSIILYPGIAAASFPPPRSPLAFGLSSNSECVELVKNVEPMPSVLAVVEGKGNGNGNGNSSGVSAGVSAGSDYGGDSVFDDFVDIDALDTEIEIRDDMEEVRLDTVEPVRMANGKWQCNHPCSDGQATKKGQPCRHRCCKEGLDKPRKVQKRKPRVVDGDQRGLKNKATPQNSAKTTKKFSSGRLKPTLRLEAHDMHFEDVEELDLVNEPLMIESLQNSVNGAPKAITSSFKSSRDVSIGKSAIDSFYSNTIRVPQDLPFLNQQADGSDEDLPSPSELLRIRDLHESTGVDRGNTLPNKTHDCSGIVEISQSTLQTSESFENATFDFDPFDNLPQLRPSLHTKRAVPSDSVEQQSKRLRIDAEQKERAESNVGDRELEKLEPQQVPDWAEGFEPDLVAYFFGPDLW